MTDATAAVRCFGLPAGTLTAGPAGMAFAYDAAWIAGGHPPLSQSLPLSGDFAAAAATAFFGGLLPEGAPRALLARQLGVSPDNDFSLLTALGGDTAGAISVVPPDGTADDGDGGVQWLAVDEVAQLIDDLPTRPMHADEQGEWRLSLAGAQDKLPVVVSEDGTIGLTRGRTPSTHILKTPIDRLDDTVFNEAFCLRFAAALGGRGRRRVTVVDAQPIHADGRDALLVRRYDREHGEGETRRLHQEDLCQALAIPTARKYESEGGPGVAECVALLRDAARGRSVAAFLDYLAISFLVGNHDAHGKNYSLLYSHGDARGVLAPAYDILSTVAYHGTHRLTRKMAMRIGGEYRPEYVEERHIARMCEAADLGLAATRRRWHSLASAAPAVAARLRREFEHQGWGRPVIERICDVVDRRAALLQRVTVGGGGAP